MRSLINEVVVEWSVVKRKCARYRTRRVELVTKKVGFDQIRFEKIKFRSEKWLRLEARIRSNSWNILLLSISLKLLNYRLLYIDIFIKRSSFL